MLYLPAEFPLDAELAYLNHAAVAPLPKRSATALSNFAFENMTYGATNYLEWIKRLNSLKSNLAELIGASDAADIALVKNTSEGLSIIAYGIDWKAGDEIVGIAHEFPSNVVVWESLHDKGVSFHAVNTIHTKDPEQALFDACSSNTRMLAISSVHYATGLRLDLPRISQFCRDRNILLCIDAIQSIGALDFKLNDIDADFVTADGHKWMLGPEGLGFLYVRPDLRSQLKLHQFGWSMRKQPGNYDSPEWEISNTATRFEAGSPNMIGIHALDASISLLLEFSMQNIEARVKQNAAYLHEKLDIRNNIKIISRNEESRRSGIVLFDVEHKNNLDIHAKLMNKRVICANRGGGIRFSPHFYTSQFQMDLALQRLDEILET